MAYDHEHWSHVHRSAGSPWLSGWAGPDSGFQSCSSLLCVILLKSRLQERWSAGPALLMIEGGSIKELVRLPVLPVSLKVSAVSSIAIARAGHRTSPNSVRLVRIPCLPGGRSCKAMWLRAWTHNSIRGGQCIVRKNNPFYHQRQTWLWIWALPEIFAHSNPSHGLWPNAVPHVLFVRLSYGLLIHHTFI